MSRDRTYLNHIQRNIDNIQRLAQNDKRAFLVDEDKQAAILYYLHTLSESTTRLSDALRARQPQIDWQAIRGFRNRVVHDYLSVDLELVWVIIQTELDPLSEAVTALLLLTANEDDRSPSDD